MMKVSLLLEAINRMTGPIDQARRSLEGLAATARTISAGVGGRMMGMYDTTRDAAHHFRTLAGEEGIARAARSAGYLKSQLSGLTGGLTLLKYASIGAGIGLGEEFVRGVFKAGGETQAMLVTLTRLEGSATRAKAAMGWMQSFGMGAGAAFSMPDIMRSYQQAMNFGMKPQGGSLAAFADLAAGERVPLGRVLLAVKDAMEGTSTRPLANLGIKMKQGKTAGDPNSYLYSNAAGQFVTETSAKTPEATLATLVRIINAKYAGLATAQAKTVPGAIEQLHKLLYLFEAKVAGAGVFDWALKRLNEFFAYVRKASADGSLDRLAKRISAFMTGTGDKVISFLKTTDWAAVGRDISYIAGALVLLAKGIGLIANLGGGGLSGLFNLWIVSKIVGVGRALWGFKSIVVAAFRMLSPFVLRFGRLFPVVFEWIAGAIAGLAAVIGAPIEVVVVAIAALIGAAVLLWANWSKVTRFLKAAWANLGLTFAVMLGVITGSPAAIMASWAPLASFFAALWAKLPSPPSWMIALGQLGTGNVAGAVGAMLPKPAAPALKPGPARLDARWRAAADRLSQGPGALKPGGELTIRFDNAPAGMRVQRLKSHDPRFDVHVKRGPVQVGG